MSSASMRKQNERTRKTIVVVLCIEVVVPLSCYSAKWLIRYLVIPEFVVFYLVVPLSFYFVIF